MRTFAIAMTMTMKKYFAIFFVILSLGAAVTIVRSALAVGAAPAPVQIEINANLPGTHPSTSPGGWVANFYQFALLLSGILAFGAIVYGGVRYATAQGNPTAESEGKSWITSALLGLLLLAGAYVILYTINPNILSLSLPLLPQVGGAVPAAPGAPAGLSGDATFNALRGAGIDIASPINTAGVQLQTITALKDLQQKCNGAPVTVTSLTGGAHSAGGGCTHANGYKADVRPNDALNACITGSGFTQVAPRNDGAPQYVAPDGAIFADERTKPPNCGEGNPTRCHWTASHWDMSACTVH